MQDNINSYLNQICNENILNENDKEPIIEMYNNIISYNFDDLFDVSTIIFKLTNFNIKSLFNPKQNITHVTICEDTIEYVENIDDFNSMDVNKLYKGTIISTDTNSIFKTFIINDQHIWRDYYCINYLIELYFNMIINDTFKLNNDDIIIPEIKKWGKVNLKNNLTMFFFETQLYEQKTIYDIIDNLYNENKYNEIRSIIERLKQTYENIYNALTHKNIYQSFYPNLNSHYNIIINEIHTDASRHGVNELIKFFASCGVFLTDEKYIFVGHSKKTRQNKSILEALHLWPENNKINDLKL